MKFIKWLIPFALIVLVSCQDQQNTGYSIAVESIKLHNGLRSYIKEFDERGREVVRDTAVAMNNSLEFKGEVEYPKIVFLSIDGTVGQLMLFLENTDMSIELDTLNIAKSKISGSQLNEELATFNQEIVELRMSLQPYVVAFRQARRDGDQVKADSLQTIMEDISLKSLYFPLEYAKSNPSSYVSMYVVDSQIGSNAQLNYEDYSAAYEALDSSLKSTVVGKRIQKKLDIERQKFEREKITSIGATAPEFKGPTPEGGELALSEVYSKGKYTIIDFWAAWCGPCRRENPNVVRIYEKYHDKGLEIIGVSLDGNRNQKDPKDAWIKAIEADRLNWNHVSNLQYFGPIARQYNVNAIPAMFIVDNTGKIVAKNLRGRALENKIEELLGS
ncbi:TlpA disulfide reductase family protein [Winogradskyella aurantiaca]|uniref:TlpA disulfide reductase family protein n=1 Tax=Winogradskyella aurantiaca TaxID=2219558 RepID=UPI000E1D4C48|nr:TlpA disulfide reductase family protein [Winogradskyella aurantiaca]